VALETLLLGTLLPAAQPRRVDGPEAREQLRLCVELPKQEGVAACRQAIALGLSTARSVVAHRLLARKLSVLKRWDELADTYRSLAALRPEDADPRLRLGLALLHGQGRAEEAEAPLREAVRLDPGDARAHASLGAALNALGRHAEALAAFGEALKLEPGHFDAWPAARRIYEASQRGEKWP
jgi:tetratricopeptide (TPR) repeat protein